MTDCLNASFYVSIKVISSKQSLGTINLPGVCREPGKDYCRGLEVWPEGLSQGCGAGRKEVGRKQEERVNRSRDWVDMGEGPWGSLVTLGFEK